MGVPVIRVQAAPTHGTLVSEAGDYFTTYPKENQRYACNVKKSTGALVYYTSAPGYTGVDSALINVVFPDGGTRTIRYSIAVE
jgi:hypothetical protein